MIKVNNLVVKVGNEMIRLFIEKEIEVVNVYIKKILNFIEI